MKKIISKLLEPIDKTLIQLMILFCALLFIGAIPKVDPTRPPKSASVSGKSNQPLQLTAIFIYPKYSIAIINGKIVKVGDQIDEFTVTTIRPFTVELNGPQNSKEVLQLITPVRKIR